MKAPRPRPSSPALARENGELRLRLSEAEETLRAIRTGEADAVVTAGKEGLQVFTLEGAEQPYRVLIESMNEGALTLTPDKMILYANQCFARMVRCPLEQVIGGSFRRFLSSEGRAMLRPLLQRAGQSGSKLQVLLKARDGSQMPVQISLRPLDMGGFKHAPIGMVVTDLTEARRSEEMLRSLAHRVVQVQEAERGRVAVELHDGITQMLCGIMFRSQALVASLAARDGPAKGEARKLRDLASQTAKEVERVSHNLRPSVLDQLGLVAALRGAGAEFADRTGLSVKLSCTPLTLRLPAARELTLYRILQEALRNVEKHARARHVAVSLAPVGAFVRLTIKDDGIGFDPGRPSRGGKGKSGLGLLSMRERAAYVGGGLTVRSVQREGTEIEVRVPAGPVAAAA